jgi:hypothetical protein
MPPQHFGKVKAKVAPVQMKGKFISVLVADFDIKTSGQRHNKLILSSESMTASGFPSGHIVNKICPFYFKRDVVAAFKKRQVSSGVKDFWQGY